MGRAPRFRDWLIDFAIMVVVVVVAAGLLERCGLYLPGRAPISTEAIHEQR